MLSAYPSNQKKKRRRLFGQPRAAYLVGYEFGSEYRVRYVIGLDGPESAVRSEADRIEGNRLGPVPRVAPYQGEAGYDLTLLVDFVEGEV
jgi:hypothetical protein